jgi:uncharacterized protein (UPF0548 family)
MLLIREPSPAAVRQFLQSQSGLDFTYPAVGATASQPPSGFVVDHTRVRLGDGERVYAAAKSALEAWEQFRLGWLEVRPNGTPIQEGQAVAVVARLFGVWWLNACRIAYLIEDQGTYRFGFAYGTLPGHVEQGEERFQVEMSKDGSVWYDILAFSRPNQLVARVGYPYIRRLQKRFGRESAARMKEVTG